MSRSWWLAGTLLLANVTYFAWTQGGLAVFGAVPAAFSEHEPQRLAQQIRPGLLQIRKGTPAAAAQAPAVPVQPPVPAEVTPDPESR